MYWLFSVLYQFVTGNLILLDTGQYAINGKRHNRPVQNQKKMMIQTASVISENHQIISNLLNKLDITLHPDNDSPPWWQVISLVRSLENACLKQAGLLADVSGKMADPHWVVIMVLARAESRVAAAQRLIQTLKKGVVPFVTSPDTTLSITSIAALSRLTGEIREKLSPRDDVVLRMLAVLAYVPNKPATRRTTRLKLIE